MKSDKKSLGQFFTISNPFYLSIFKKWFSLIPGDKKSTLLEPFAGSNNLVKMFNSLGLDEKEKWNWKCYDISISEENNAPDYKIIQQDTLKSFPKGFTVAITNPPYLAKNSAARQKLEFPNTIYDDLYKYCLHIMLENLEYVAAIVPESFINCNLFRNRLYAISSLTCKMFNETECPVCLALFIPDVQKTNLNMDSDDYLVYKMDTKLGNYKDIKLKINTILNCDYTTSNWKFNDKTGKIGIRCIDNTKTASISFVRGQEIEIDKIKQSSRSLTIISGLPADVDIEVFINECNRILCEYRDLTYDIFMTSFKGLRSDNCYRRRLDFKTAKIIMDVALTNIRLRDCLN